MPPPMGPDLRTLLDRAAVARAEVVFLALELRRATAASDRRQRACAESLPPPWNARRDDRAAGVIRNL